MIKNRYILFGVALLWTVIAAVFFQYWRVHEKNRLETLALDRAMALDAYMGEMIRWNIMYGTGFFSIPPSRCLRR
ncbi:hypothetical protein BMS3Abin14_01068 [bacterium BMS3Abin14]|nr:hypothetical protein BMS3Abin14_01068 [bacterium BMS3Abin14]